MADVVNLRTVRKRAKMQLAEKDASKNRLAHGRSKSERKLDEARRAKADAIWTNIGLERENRE